MNKCVVNTALGRWKNTRSQAGSNFLGERNRNELMSARFLFHVHFATGGIPKWFQRCLLYHVISVLHTSACLFLLLLKPIISFLLQLEHSLLVFLLPTPSHPSHPSRTVLEQSWNSLGTVLEQSWTVAQQREAREALGSRIDPFLTAEYRGVLLLLLSFLKILVCFPAPENNFASVRHC